MSDRDERLVKKGAAKKALESFRKYFHFTTFGKMVAAIDALEPIAEVQDAVSRVEVVRIVDKTPECNFDHSGHYAEGARVNAILRALAKLPPVLPIAESKRSDEEIQVAIETLETIALNPTKRHWFAEIASHMAEMGRYCLGEKTYHSQFFAPPFDKAQEKEKEEPGGKD